MLLVIVQNTLFIFLPLTITTRGRSNWRRAARESPDKTDDDPLFGARHSQFVRKMCPAEPRQDRSMPC